MSGCLLAANNPSTSAGIVGSGHEALHHPLTPAPTWTTTLRPGDSSYKSHKGGWERFSRIYLGWNNSYDTRFQPVSLWSKSPFPDYIFLNIEVSQNFYEATNSLHIGRGTNKMAWIRESEAYRNPEDDSFKKLMVITRYGWFFKVFMPTISLVVLPPATGGVVAYFTPPRGLGCRSLSFIVYAFCQVVVTIFALFSNALDDGYHCKNKLAKCFFTGKGLRIISSPFWFGSFIAAVGGATMQVVGVYRNCICYSGASNWYNLTGINPAINIASDTLDQRNSSGYWIWMGITATAFMAVNTYIGWW
jgi:hypothetical protein